MAVKSAPTAPGVNFGLGYLYGRCGSTMMQRNRSKVNCLLTRRTRKLWASWGRRAEAGKSGEGPATARARHRFAPDIAVANWIWAPS